MTEEIKFNLDIAEESMNDVVMHLEKTLQKIRAGKANPQMLNVVKIEYYGVVTPLSQAAKVSAPASKKPNGAAYALNPASIAKL